MRPKKHKRRDQNDLFRARLDQSINMKHELVLLAGKIDWTGSTAISRRSMARTAGRGDPLHDRAVVAQAHLRAVR